MAKPVIIILAMNQKEKTLQCLATLFESSPTQYQVIVWDNGSVDETAVAIRQFFPDTLVHEHPTNLGVASGHNAAAKLHLMQCTTERGSATSAVPAPASYAGRRTPSTTAKLTGANITL